MSKGISHRVNVTVHNNTNHQILLKGRTVLGRLDPIKSIVPADAKLASTTFSDSTQSRTVFQQKDTNISETKSQSVSPDSSSSLT